MSQQKALFINVKGGDFELGTRPIPKAKQDHIVVKIHAIGLNPIEPYLQKGYVPLLEHFPTVLGFDAAGEVEYAEVNSQFKPGDRVIFQTHLGEPDFGAFQQYMLVDSRLAARLPSTISFEQAATLPTGLATATSGLFVSKYFGLAFPNGTKQYAGHAILIVGGSSIVGQCTIQFAKLSGFDTIVTTASAKHTKTLKALGATHVVDRTIPIQDQAAEIRKAAPGLKLVYIAVANRDSAELAVAVTEDGPDSKVVLTNAVEGVHWGKRAPSNLATIFSTDEETKVWTSIYRKLSSMLESGDIKTLNFERVQGGLTGIPAALDKLFAGQVSGAKLIANPWE